MGRDAFSMNGSQRPVDTRRVRITRWEPASGDAWSKVVDESDHAGVEHLSQWLTVIKGAYGHSPLYFLGEDEDGVGGVLPAFLVRSRLFGAVVTSMPFLDAGGPCSRSRPLARALVDHLIRLAARLGAGRVELRCTTEMDLPVPAMRDKV